MPDTRQPYGYIEMEIERLKFAERKANTEASMKTLEAEIHRLNRMELESALEKQKEADAAREI